MLWPIAYLHARAQMIGRGAQIQDLSSSIAFTPISYYDTAGLPLRNSFPLPELAGLPFEITIRTNRGDMASFSSNPTPAATSTAVPSLLSLSLQTALHHLPPNEVRSMLSDEVPHTIERPLVWAEDNARLEFSPILHCDYCSREYVVPRAAWIDFRVLEYEIIPLKWKVCSWACAQEWHATV